ncbi:DUF3592 domain-containing protein [Bremerella sp. T1]|uniref:DUF3592 domain-containing protein n=1 Tax=Bremerella sp. TYQ1 TaxID=3119568 RepID=UPI001CCE087C|nr:DUF3592 domain-containing protein [Bremerella volcania]UBM34457.1 DUF3592 domain-containing protein [Bremerella volcania]
MKEIIAALMMGGFNLIGLVIVGFGLRDLYVGWRSRSWEKTSGRLTDAIVEESVQKSSKSRRTVYEVIATYEYDAGGRPQQGNTIAFSYGPTSEREEHRLLQESLKQMPHLTVFYDPLRPEKSTLLPGIDSGMFTLVALGAMWLSVTVGITVMFFLIQGGDPELVRGIAAG